MGRSHHPPSPRNPTRESVGNHRQSRGVHRLDTGTAAGVADSFTVRLGAGSGGAANVVWVDTRTDGINGDIYFNFAD